MLNSFFANILQDHAHPSTDRWQRLQIGKITLAVDVENPLKTDKVFCAYPLRTDSTEDKTRPLIVKIFIADPNAYTIEQIFANNSGSTTTAWHKARPLKNKPDIDNEAKNGNILFASKVYTIIGGAIIIMPKICGESLATLIDTHAFKKLTPRARLTLAISALNNYAKLHDNGVFHRDIKADNILIDLSTLSAIPVDIDPSHDNPLTRPPEHEETAIATDYALTQDILPPVLSGHHRINDSMDLPKASTKPESTSQSDIYSLAQDILTPLLSGVRPMISINGNTINPVAIADGFNKNFKSTNDNAYIKAGASDNATIISNLLTAMQNKDPNKRPSIQTAINSLQQITDALPQPKAQSTFFNITFFTKQSSPELTAQQQRYDEPLLLTA